MSQITTDEIDLRPTWRRLAIDAERLSSLRRFIAIAAGACAILTAGYLLGRGSDRGLETQPERPAIQPKAPVVVPQESARPPLTPPIVINATREIQAKPVVQAPAPAMQEKGSLKLTSDPEVTVLDGDVRLGRTPIESRLSPGRHEIHVVNNALMIDTKMNVDIRSGQTSMRELSFGVGALRVIAPDKTRIYLNGRFIGETPYKKITLAEGNYQLRLKHGEETQSETIEIPAASTVDYRVHFADE
jgi:hypothetical protein